MPYGFVLGVLWTGNVKTPSRYIFATIKSTKIYFIGDNENLIVLSGCSVLLV